MQQKNYSIFLISKRPERYAKIQESLLPELLYYCDSTEAESFSKLINSCVDIAPTEIVIFVNDNIHPKDQHIHKIISLLNTGYGFVGLNQFEFFGFKKELLRKIGMFDERFVGGGWETGDMVNRLIVSNIAFFITEEVESESDTMPWAHDPESISANFFTQKWFPHWGKGSIPNVPILEKKLTEEKYNYNLGPNVYAKFLHCHQYSHVSGSNANYYMAPMLKTKIYSSVPLEYLNH